MDLKTKEILQKALYDFRTSERDKKDEMVSYVEKNIKDHERLLNEVGEGYADCLVRAGKIFLRITQPHTVRTSVENNQQKQQTK